MAADRVPRAPEMAHLGRVEKRGATDQARDHEEVPSPTAPAQLVADVQGAAAAIVEGEQHMTARAREVDLGDELRRYRTRRDTVQMPGEGQAAQLVGNGSGALQPGAPGLVGHVMVGEPGDLGVM